MLLSTSSMDLMGDQELVCTIDDCGKTFKYQGALDKHIARHEQEMFSPQEVKKMKLEDADDSMNNIKLEPSALNTDDNDGDEKLQDENDFLDKLLSDLDVVPAGVAKEDNNRRKKKKKIKLCTRDFKCSDCGKAFYFQKNLFSHVVEKHGKSIDELPNLNELKEEYIPVTRKKTKEKNKPVVCDECGVSFKFASGLYNHRKRMHGDTAKKRCPHCEKEVKSCTLDQHIREEHGTPRFACQFCGKGFYYKSFMLNHQRLHTGDYKECVCDLCGAVYKSVQVLNRHVRNAHQDLRNHKCQHCDKAFHNRQRLERHINSQHTKAKIWPCPVCHSRYDRKDNLRTHIRKNHANAVNPDTVELTSINNDSGFIDIKNRTKAGPAEPTIDPETGELERSGASTKVASEGHQTTTVHQLILDRSQPVHVAHDLLSLKYGGGEDSPQFRTITLAAASDIKHEMVTANQYNTVKLEHPEIVMAGSGVKQIVKTLGREIVVSSSSSQTGAVVVQPTAGYIFPSQTDH